MKVRVINTMGFDGLKRRRVGEVFELKNPKLFSKNWMEKVEDEKSESKPAKPSKSKKAKEDKADKEVI